MKKTSPANNCIICKFSGYPFEEGSHIFGQKLLIRQLNVDKEIKINNRPCDFFHGQRLQAIASLYSQASRREHSASQ